MTGPAQSPPRTQGAEPARKANVVMTPTQLPPSPTTSVGRLPLRLRLRRRLGDGALDGSWWPRSRDLSLELADLVQNFPIELGQVRRVVFSRADWDTAPHRVRVARGLIKVGSYPRDDTHQVWLSMSTHTMIRLAVMDSEGSEQPPPLTRLAAPARPAAADVGDEQRLGDDSHWHDDGGSWWDPHPVAPSERV